MGKRMTRRLYAINRGEREGLFPNNLANTMRKHFSEREVFALYDGMRNTVWGRKMIRKYDQKNKLKKVM